MHISWQSVRRLYDQQYSRKALPLQLRESSQRRVSFKLAGRPLRLALIGLGHRTLTKALPALRPLNLSIVAGVDPLLTSEFNHEQLSNTKFFKSVTDLTMMMNSNWRPDVAFVALPHSEYPITVSHLLRHKIDVIQEKPLAISVSEGLACVALAEQNGIRLGVAAQRRFSMRYSKLLEWLPMVGIVRAVQVAEKIEVLDLDDGWRASKAKAGGGAVLDLGYHMIDQLISLFGPDCIVNHARLLKTRTLSGTYDVEDTVHAQLTFQHGSDGDIPVNLVLSRAGDQADEFLEIIGERGVLRLHNGVVTLNGTGRHSSDLQKASLQCVEPGHVLLHAALRSFFAGGDTAKWDCQRDLAVLRVIEAIYANTQIRTVVHTAFSSPLTLDGKSLKKWTWPRITSQLKADVIRQLDTTLSIYDNSGVFADFETEFKFAMGVPSAFALLHNSGTNALHALYYSAGIGKGDEVIVPVYTFHATVSCLMQLGCIPVFVDCLPDTGNIDPEGIRMALTPRTKAVVVTHMWGHPCAMSEIAELCKDANVLLLEDCSHAHGASINGKIVGTFGDGAAWSIQGDKVISGGEGGVTLTRNPEIYYRQLIFGHYNKRCKAEIPPTHPLAAFSLTGAGLKNRAHPLAIAIALNQLRQLPIMKKFKSKYATILTESLRSVDFLHGPNISPTAQPGWYTLVVNFNSSAAPSDLTRERFVAELAARGLVDVDIPNSVRPLYAEPLYLRPWEIFPHNYDPNTYQPRWTPADFPYADEFHRTAIKFPVWACEDDLDVVQSYATIIKDVAKDFMTENLSLTCQ